MLPGKQSLPYDFQGYANHVAVLLLVRGNRHDGELLSILSARTDVHLRLHIRKRKGSASLLIHLGADNNPLSSFRVLDSRRNVEVLD